MSASAKRTERRGAVLVAVLVTLMAASVLFGAMLRTSRQEQQLLRSQQVRLQVIELAQAAVDRAAAQLAANPEYTSETWRISAAELSSRESAIVQIEVQSLAEGPQRRRVRVEVKYPPTGERRVQHHHEALIDLPEKDHPS